MSARDAERCFERYLAVLNGRRWDELADVVHDHLTHDGRAMTRQQFTDLLREDVATIPDLRYEVRLLVVEETASPPGCGSSAPQCAPSAASTPAAGA